MPLAIFCALRWECRPVLKALGQVSRQPVGRWRTWHGTSSVGEVVVVQTGVGPDRAGAAAHAIAESGSFDLFLSTGCAGALGDELRPGDLVIASAVAGEGERFEVDAAFQAQVAAICAQRRLPCHAGVVLTSPTVLTTMAARREAVERSGAIAVEMEAAAIARAAAQYGIPFAEVRSVLDSADVELHESGDFMDPESGRVRPLELMKVVAANPGVVSHLLSLRRMMTAAEASLAQLFAAYLG